MRSLSECILSLSYVALARLHRATRRSRRAVAAGPPQLARAVHSRPLAHRRRTGGAPATSRHRLREHALAGQRQQQRGLLRSELHVDQPVHHLHDGERVEPLPEAAEVADERRRGGDDDPRRLVGRQRICNECDPNG